MLSYTLVSGVTLVGIPIDDVPKLQSYLGWTKMMFRKLHRPKLVLPDSGLRTLNLIDRLEVPTRALIPNAGWSGPDSSTFDDLRHGSDQLVQTVWMPGTTMAATYDGVVFGFAEEFVKRCATLFPRPGANLQLLHPWTVRRLCMTLDRRLPKRTPEPTREGIDLMVSFFGAIGGYIDWNRNETPTAQQNLLKRLGVPIVKNLATTTDAKDAEAAVARWVTTLAAERHLSKAFVEKTLDIRNICG